MKVVFMGTPDFAVAPLSEINKNFEIAAVITQPDKIANHKKLTPPPVKTVAESLGLAVYQFERVSRDGLDLITELKPDVIVTAAYGQLLSEKFLAVPRYGTLNVHASLLPKYRGAAPINQALFDGEKTTGVTIMRTVKKLDAGDILLAESVNIDENMNAGALTERLSKLGSELIVRALTLVENGKAVFMPQNEAEATTCGKIKPEMEKIDWSKPSFAIHNLVRGLSPTPSAWTFLNGKRLKIFATELSDDVSAAGIVSKADKNGIVVGCGEKSLVIKTLQYEGGKVINAWDFINGRKVAVGDKME